MNMYLKFGSGRPRIRSSSPSAVALLLSPLPGKRGQATDAARVRAVLKAVAASHGRPRSFVHVVTLVTRVRSAASKFIVIIIVVDF